MTAPPTQPEVWLRGPVSGVPVPLQPVAHALLQALEDVERLTGELTQAEVWTSIGGAATVGFHLRHMAGSLERLLTYARGEALTEEQRHALADEKDHTPEVGAAELLHALRSAVDGGLGQLRSTEPSTVADARSVGRAGYPSTVLGLLFHAGEHTTRHAGQISTTVRVLTGLRASGPS
jgi:uncharacterized damage-inducible protein DinB